LTERNRFTEDLDVDDWRLIATAPPDRDLELSVIETGEVHALVFPCRRAAKGWINASTKSSVVVDPTHWRPWSSTARCVLNSGALVPVEPGDPAS
jgi:hypothetical protein